jgi:hypothetical protein
MTVDAWAQPVLTSCIDPVGTVRVTVWPRSSERVRVPAPLVNTRRLVRICGAGENRNVRDVPEGKSKKMWFVGSTL